MNVRPSAPTLRLRTLPWRHPWARPALKWTLIILFAAAFMLLWRWRMTNTPSYVLERDPLPATAITLPTPELPAYYLRPTAGPPEW
jgi:hypothetical protein